ncbi:hypothetical protein [Streptomyces sp. NPDC006368]|uniref:hypothetical protein n=1 Tax=Streptomyces sp. NPDC006368 TaxID=3156760 RepID=UPI0033B122A5
MEAGPRDREQYEAPDDMAPDGTGPGGTGPDGTGSGAAPARSDARVADVPGLSPDGPELNEDGVQEIAPNEVEVELRPQRKLRIWQLAPIVGLGVIGSLMFGFPLAFGSGDGGAVLAMLGLLLCGCAAGWGMMAARRVGYTWPGLPARGSGERPDWRVIALYVAGVAVLVALAVWRVARLR